MTDKPKFPAYGHYILKGKKPVKVDNLFKWATWFEKADRHVKDERIGDVRISTVFLGIDHNWGIEGNPLLFETMVFGGPMDSEMDRYSTWGEAVKGHNRMVREVMKKGK